MGENSQVFVVTLQDETKVHVGVDRRRGETETFTPADNNVSDSQQLLSEITRLAETNSGRVDRSLNRRQSPLTRHHADGGMSYDLIQLLVAIFGGGGAGWAFIKQCKPLFIQWLKNKQSRSITAKYGDIEVTVTGSNDIDKLIEAFQKLERARVRAAPVDASGAKSDTPAKEKKATDQPSRRVNAATKRRAPPGKS